MAKEIYFVGTHGINGDEWIAFDEGVEAAGYVRNLRTRAGM